MRKKIANKISFLLNNIKYFVTYFIILISAILCGTIPNNSLINDIYSISILNKLDFSFVEITSTPFFHDSFLNLTQFVNTGSLDADVLMLLKNVDYDKSLMNYNVNQEKFNRKYYDNNYCFVTGQIPKNGVIKISFTDNDSILKYEPIQIVTFKGLDNYYSNSKIIFIPFNQSIYSKITTREYISFVKNGDAISNSRFSLSKKDLISISGKDFTLSLTISLCIFLLILFGGYLINRVEIYKTIKNDFLEGISFKKLIAKTLSSFLPLILITIIVSFLSVITLIKLFGYFVIIFALIPIFISILVTSLGIVLVCRGIKYEWFLFRCFYKNKQKKSDN